MGIGVSRRSVLKGSVVGTAAVALGAKAGAAPAGSVDIESPLIFHSPEFEPFCDELHSLSTLSGNEITLTAQVGQHAFHRIFPRPQHCRTAAERSVAVIWALPSRRIPASRSC